VQRAKGRGVGKFDRRLQKVKEGCKHMTTSWMCLEGRTVGEKAANNTSVVNMPRAELPGVELCFEIAFEEKRAFGLWPFVFPYLLSLGAVLFRCDPISLGRILGQINKHIYFSSASVSKDLV
jgi:hypothetical protein